MMRKLAKTVTFDTIAINDVRWEWQDIELRKIIYIIPRTTCSDEHRRNRNGSKE